MSNVCTVERHVTWMNEYRITNPTTNVWGSNSLYSRVSTRIPNHPFNFKYISYILRGNGFKSDLGTTSILFSEKIEMRSRLWTLWLTKSLFSPLGTKYTSSGSMTFNKPYFNHGRVSWGSSHNVISCDLYTVPQLGDPVIHSCWENSPKHFWRVSQCHLIKSMCRGRLKVHCFEQYFLMFLLPSCVVWKYSSQRSLPL